jgi:ATP-binding protein involved in chromosome partitioning
MTTPALDEIQAALATVNDPEIRRPITELGMVDSVDVAADGKVAVHVLLTVSGCPLKDTITRDVTAAVSKVPGVTGVDLTLGVMTPEQRAGLQEVLRGGQTQKEILFARSDSLTKVYAIASGKGGVGKSSVTVNLAAAMAKQGLKVGIVDADIYGHSVPAMLGVGDVRPTQVEDMIMPVPTGEGISVISIGMLKPRRDQVVAWRGPMLDRALVQMLSDVYWGDLDALFLDLPPGTGDIAISLGQHLPNAEVVVVTTPQEAAAEVAERAGTMASMMHQRVVGVVENMSFLPCPHCGPEHRLEVFGAGGGARVAATLSKRFGYDVPVLGEIPLDLALREGGDAGRPIVDVDPESASATALTKVAATLSGRGRGLAGMQLGLTPAGRLERCSESACPSWR